MVKPQPDQVAAGRVAGTIHRQVGAMIKPGLNLLEIEAFIAEEIARSGMTAPFQGYHGYPSVSCLSVNSVVVHGIPRDYVLRAGDVLAVDLGVAQNGWIVDTAVTHIVGQGSAEAVSLLETTKTALDEAIRLARPGHYTGDIGNKIQTIVETAGFFIIKELTGHGVGRQLQMAPNVPNFGQIGQGTRLEEGMVIAIEPITALQKVQVKVEADDWTIRAYPDVITGHFEHTVFIGPDEPIILTA